MSVKFETNITTRVHIVTNYKELHIVVKIKKLDLLRDGILNFRT